MYVGMPYFDYFIITRLLLHYDSCGLVRHSFIASG